MIDYPQLKADDPGGSIASAFIYLSTLTITIKLESSFITVANVSARYGMGFAEGIYSAMQMFDEDNATPENPYFLPGWVIDAFGPFGNGFDIGSQRTQDEIASAASVGVFTQVQHDALLAMTSDSAIKYQGLTPGDVEYARKL